MVAMREQHWDRLEVKNASTKFLRLWRWRSGNWLDKIGYDSTVDKH